MLRHAAMVLVAVCLNVTPALAQMATFTVGAAPADVYKAPSTGSPIVGHAPRGAVLEVTRELGSWVRVPWPDAPEGVGFVHVSTGRIVNGAPAEAVRAAAGAVVRASADQAAAPVEDAVAASRQDRIVRSRPPTPVPHGVGVGGAMVSGSPYGFGATARMWRQNRLGVRIDLSRYAMEIVPTGRARAVHVEPSLLVSVGDHITNYLWLRPYVGTGLAVRHQTMAGSALGFQAFGGVELTHAAAPQLAVSADLGYRSKPSGVNVIHVGGFGVSMSAHWYVR